MKRITVIALLAVAGIISTGKALAQSDEVRVAVPFDFAVGNKVLPAGTYLITSPSDWVIEIQNQNTRDAMLALVAGDNDQSAKNVLVFDKHSNHYFLREILCDSAKMNVSLPRATIEKIARQEEAKNPTGGGDGDQVTLALK